MSKTKILISDIHPLARQALVTTLNALGYNNVYATTDKNSAAALINEEKDFDILFFSIGAQADDVHFIRTLNAHGNIKNIVVISDTAPDIQIALRSLARASGVNLLGQLRNKHTRNDVLDVMARLAPTFEPQYRSTTEADLPAKAIANAVQHDQFIPFYQPKVDLQTMKVVGAELLMRWEHPEIGIVGPNRFIDIAKRFGHLDTMTLSILRKALHFLRCATLDNGFKLSINIDASQLAKPDLAKKIAAMLQSEGVRPEALIIEITETGLLKSPTECLANLIHLRLLGCGVSIDDFGAGLSSLQRVCELPCTELKLDMCFTKAIMHNQRVQLSVSSMARLSSEMGVDLVAEGIETADQLELLQNFGCTIGQGYIFSPPLPESQFMAWMSNESNIKHTNIN